MADLQQDMDEYAAIKRWLKGEKPPGIGRVVYRKVQEKIQHIAAMPREQPAVFHAWAAQLCTMVIGALLIGTAPLVVQLLIPPAMMAEPQTGLYLLETGLRTIMTLVQPVALGIAGLSTGIAFFRILWL